MSADKAFDEWWDKQDYWPDDCMGAAQEAWLASRKAALEEAAKVCIAHVRKGQTNDAMDAGYNLACADIADAMRP